MNHHENICLDDLAWAELTPNERERFNAVLCELNTYRTKQPPTGGTTIDFPPAAGRALWGVWLSSTPTALPKSLFSQLAYADMTVTTLASDDRLAATWLKPSGSDVEETFLLSTLIDYFLSVIGDQPFLEKRSYISYLTLFLTHVIIDRSVTEEAHVFQALYSTLCQFPVVRVSEGLHSTIPYPSETLSIGIGILRCLSRGYSLPCIDLFASFAGQESQMRSVSQLIDHLSDPRSEEIVVSDVRVVLLPRDPQHQTECRETIRTRAGDTCFLLLSDIVTQVVMSPYNNERESVFVLRRLSNVIAQILNSSVKGIPCDAYADVFPWLYQCRKNLLLGGVSNIISPDKQ